jgi:MinD-like ATPase involved in chromosome partitioning or flagellar assembly
MRMPIPRKENDEMRWLACASGRGASELRAVVRGIDPEAEVVVMEDPVALRVALLREPPGEVSVAVSEDAFGMTPVNLAAAIVADGHAARVLLVCRLASGSLRSRAHRAGITEIVDPDDVLAAVRTRAQTGDPAAYGLDEPDDETPAASEPEEVPEAHITKTRVIDANGVPEVRSGGIAEGVAPVLCVASGRGGVGKSVTAALLAAAAASWGMRCALVDADLCSGNLFSYFGLEGGSDLSRLAELEEVGAADVDALSVRISDRLSLWGPCSRPELAETLGWRFTKVLDLLAESSDLVVVDCSTTVTDAVAQALQRSDRVLLVGDEERGAVGSLARVAALCVRLGVARTRIVRVMGRCDWRSSDDPAVYRAAVGLETARTCRLIDGGPDVGELLLAGKVLELADSDNDFTLSAESCLATILSELGRLPDASGAEKALKRSQGKRRRGIFRKRKMKEAS